MESAQLKRGKYKVTGMYYPKFAVVWNNCKYFLQEQYDPFKTKESAMKTLTKLKQTTDCFYRLVKYREKYYIYKRQ